MYGGMLVAIGHIIAVVVVHVLIGLLSLAISNGNSQRVARRLMADAALSLGVPVAQLDEPRNAERVEQYLAGRVSPELLRNRLSDLAGVVLTIFYWVSGAASVLILLWVIYLSISEDGGNAVHAWWLVPIALGSWAIAIVWSMLCHALTGRYPGEASSTRKVLLEDIERRHLARQRREREGAHY